MAFERINQKKVIASNLNAYIQSSLTLLSNQRARTNALREARFLTAVIDDNLSYDDQLEWRKNQLKEIPRSDKEERARIKKEIATIKDLQEVQEYNDKYLAEVMKLNSGMQSIDSTINWLNNRLANTTDLSIKNSIKTQLNDLKAKQYTQRQTILQNKTTFAENDKSETVVTTQINNLSNERRKALLNGNEDFVATLDIQIQSLNKVLSEQKISNAITNMSVSSMTGQSALALLNEFNSMVQTAGTDIPVTIGGVRFGNAREFWNAKRSEYLNDRSANGFFARYGEELTAKVNYKQSKNVLKNTDLNDVNSWYENLKDRPELVGYEEKINQEQQKNLKYAADLKANSIVNQFATDSNAVKAVNGLAYLQDNFGVNMTTSYQKVIQTAANEKAGQFQNILGAMSSIMKDNPGMGQEEALKLAIKSGAGATFSAEELATKTTSELVTESGKKAEGEQFTDTSTTTVPKDQTQTFQPPTDMQEGGFFKLPNSSAVYKLEGGKLRPFEGNWTDETFQQATGKTFADVQTVKDVSGVEQGTPIKTTDFNLSNTEVNKRVQQPEQPTQPAPEVKPTTPQYKIQQGDTLTRIARQNKTTVDEILKSNPNIKDPNKIIAGESLILPNQQ